MGHSLPPSLPHTSRPTRTRRDQTLMEKRGRRVAVVKDKGRGRDEKKIDGGRRGVAVVKEDKEIEEELEA